MSPFEIASLYISSSLVPALVNNLVSHAPHDEEKEDGLKHK